MNTQEEELNTQEEELNTQTKPVDGKNVEQFAIKGLLRDKNSWCQTQQSIIKMKTEEIFKAHDLHIKTLGRLAKYEDGICDEAIKYAFDKYLYIKCNSSKVGLKTIINPYQKKDGTVSKKKAHYTQGGKFYRMCNNNDEEPIYYDGYFNYKNHKEQFDKLKKKVSYFEKIEDLFDL
jgi:hypothetical protein